jgi:Glycosyl transferase family 2
MGGTRICFVSASGQNVFFAEILEAFAAALRTEGFAVEESVDCFPAPADDLVCLYIPHEFHPLVEELSHPTSAQLRRTIAVCTEQPGTQWFDLACGIAARAGAVVDINVLGVKELRRRGVPAEHAPLGHVPAWDRWGGADGAERSIDLAFLGGHTERRGQVLARCAEIPRLGRSSIYLTESLKPHLGMGQDFLARERKWALLADSKILLNVHRTALPYMEWHRVIGAILNGSVVLTEHALGTEPLVAGEHYVSANYEMLPQVLEGLLAEPERMESIRQAAYRLVCEESPLGRTFEGLGKAIERAAAGPLPPPSGGAAEPLPLPLAPHQPKPPWTEHAEHLGEMQPVRMALKHLIVKTRALEHKIDRVGRSTDPGEHELEQLGSRHEAPEVSVLLTLHNYADYVGQALRSVALSEFDGSVEVVVVDDASTDHSLEAVRTSFEEHPWLSLKLVKLHRNRGLPAARNLAAEHAASDRLFILDADNSLLPHGLARLVHALDGDPDAAFAYGVIQAFDGRRPTGLMNWLGWDPARLREGNYIDAMAMIRRSALEEVGGYATSAALYGWEDFDLWAAMAEREMHGVHVKDFVARYRNSPHSMIDLANVDSLASWGMIARRYPKLLDVGDAPG